MVFNALLRKILFILVISSVGGLALSSCAYSTTTNNYTIPQLLKLTDLNERAFIYHHYCVGSAEKLSDRFLENYEIAPNFLLDKTMETSPLKPKAIVAQIVERRERIQNLLRRHYNEKGCTSEEALTAREHYQMLKTYEGSGFFNQRH